MDDIVLIFGIWDGIGLVWGDLDGMILVLDRICRRWKDGIYWIKWYGYKEIRIWCYGWVGYEDMMGLYWY